MSLENQRAQGKPGAQRTHSLACEIKKHTSKSPQVCRNNPAFPARWFTAYSVISSVRPSFFVTVIGAMREALPPTWHLRRGARTTRLRRPHWHRSSDDAAASITSRSTFRDDRDTPLCKRGGTPELYTKSYFRKTEIFLRARIDRNLQAAPVGQINSRYQRNSSVVGFG